MPSVFDAETYRHYLVSMLDSAAHARGGRSRLAEHLGVHTSFISMVLGGDQEFSLEHGMKVAGFFGLDGEERDWFILLINHDRAGTSELKRHFKKQLDRIRSDRRKIRGQIKAKTELDPVDLIDYYAHWYTIAVHMSIHNPALRDAEALARSLRLSREHVVRSLNVLERIGFARQSNKGWLPTEARFHLSKDSPALRSHLQNWRSMAGHAIDEPNQEHMHYSLVLNINDPAVTKIRELLLDLVKKVEPVIEGAECEKIFALNLDFFGLGSA